MKSFYSTFCNHFFSINFVQSTCFCLTQLLQSTFLNQLFVLGQLFLINLFCWITLTELLPINFYFNQLYAITFFQPTLSNQLFLINFIFESTFSSQLFSINFVQSTFSNQLYFWVNFLQSTFFFDPTFPNQLFFWVNFSQSTFFESTWLRVLALKKHLG